MIIPLLKLRATGVFNYFRIVPSVFLLPYYTTCGGVIYAAGGYYLPSQSHNSVPYDNGQLKITVPQFREILVNTGLFGEKAG
jgi:hypothetical protein